MRVCGCRYIAVRCGNKMPFISLQSDTYPYLRLDGMATAAVWNVGKLYKIGLTSPFVRVTSRGLQYAVKHSHAEDLFVRPSSAWWNRGRCVLKEDGLCEQMGKEGASMLVFPSRVVDVPDAITDIAGYESIGYLKDIAETNRSCVNAHASRQIVLQDTRYEMSLCDLTDNDLDIVYDWKEGELFWRMGSNSTAFYLFVACAGIYLVSQLADNVKSILEPCEKESGEEGNADEKPHGRHGWVVVYVGVVLATVGFLVANFIHTLNLLLTQDDVLLYWVLHAFVALHTLLFVKDEFPQVRSGWWLESEGGGCDKLHRSVRGVSYLTSILLALSVHVHSSFANPYAWLLIVLFGIRSVHKMLKCVTVYKPVLLRQRVLHLWDFFVFACLLAFGVAAGSASEEAAAIDVFETVFFCVGAGMLLALKTAMSEDLRGGELL